MPRPPLRLVPSEPGRNAPCPCGSGLKYKKCHGKERHESAPSPAAAEFHRHSQELIPRLYHYADRQLDVDLIGHLQPHLIDEAALPFWSTVQLYHEVIEDKPVVDWVLEDPSFRLTPIDRAVLEAEREAWLSVWEVTAVTPGSEVVVRDLLTGIERAVTERTASASLARYDGVLARVATYRDVHLFAGLHPAALPPAETARVVSEMRRKLRLKRDVPVARLRPIKIIAHLVHCWEDIEDEMHERAHRPVALRNTDGDPLVLTVDHFAVRPEDRDRLRRLLAAMPDVDVPSPDDPEGEFVMLSRTGTLGPETIVGVVRRTRRGVMLETNSIERADRLRAALEQHAGEVLRHRIREHPPHPAIGLDSPPDREAGAAGPPDPAEIPDAERDAMVREFLDRYYRDWLDIPIPMLGDMSPREAVKSREGRQQVEVLLKGLEHRGGPGVLPVQPDVAALRRELGL